MSDTPNHRQQQSQSPTTDKTTRIADGSMDLTKPVNERFDNLRDWLRWQDDMHRHVADFPWYEEIRPGFFRLQGSRGQKNDTSEYSEDELRRKLGFVR